MKMIRAVFFKKQVLMLYLVLFTVAISVLPASLPGAPLSEKNDDYFVVKGGYYYPSARFSLDDFESPGTRSQLESKNGFNGEVAFGHYFVPMLGVEFGAGYFESKAAPPAEPGQTRLKVVPVQLSGKLFLPLGPIEPYGEVGIGAYFTKLDVSGNLGSFSGATRVTYGVHGGVGLNLNFTDTFFVGVEGRYIKAKPEFGGQPVRLDGYTATLNLGFRY